MIEREFEIEEESGLKFYSSTIASEKHPRKNEDSFFISENFGICGVFDAMGESDFNEIASQKAKEISLEEINSWFGESVKDPEEKLRTLFEKLHYNLPRRIGDVFNRHPSWSWRLGLGVAAAVAVFIKDGDKRLVTVGNIGDSRIYLYGGSELKLLSVDDRPGREEDYSSALRNIRTKRELYKLFAAPKIIQPLILLAFEKNRKTVTQVIGLGGEEEGKPPVPHIRTFEIITGETVLLCTDGIHDNLTDGEIVRILLQTKNPASCAEILCRKARAVSKKGVLRSKPDDVTAIVIKPV